MSAALEPAQIDADTRQRLQITAVIEMLTGLGHEATDERVAYYVRLLGKWPPFLLRAACDAAVMASEDGYPPAPGVIDRHARRIAAQRREDERERRQREEVRRIREEVAAREAARALELPATAGGDAVPLPPELELTVANLTRRFSMPIPVKHTREALRAQARKLASEESKP